MNVCLQFFQNHASLEQLQAHLRACDNAFIPPLSGRVDLAAYALKLVRNAVVFEAWANNQLVGVLAAYMNQMAPQTAFITNVSVVPPYQGIGIAGQLMRTCLDHAESLGYLQVELRVAAENHSATLFYARNGFVEVGRKDQEAVLHRLLGVK